MYEGFYYYSHHLFLLLEIKLTKNLISITINIENWLHVQKHNLELSKILFQTLQYVKDIAFHINHYHNKVFEQLNR